MKKKILFMLTNMNIGGTEKAFLNMISEIPSEKYDITVLLLEKKGGFLQDIPSWVNIEVLENYDEIKPLIMNSPYEIIFNLLKSFKFFKALGIAYYHLIYKIKNDRTDYYKFILRHTPKRSDEYDVAVSYCGPMDFFTVFVLDKVWAKKKIQWIHFDVSKFGFNEGLARREYAHYDRIYAVSDEARNVLINIIPEIKDKTYTFHNLLSPSLCLLQSKDNAELLKKDDNFKILTVGRMTEEKGQILVPTVLSQLKDRGYNNIIWYLVGDGNQRQNVLQEAIRLDVEDMIVFTGVQHNPYPFYKNADIYVQTSKHEGYCITLAEARLFNLPIITTDFAGAFDQIKNGINGLIVPFSAEVIADAIIRLIKDSELKDTFVRNLSEEKNYEPAKELEDFFRFIVE